MGAKFGDERFAQDRVRFAAGEAGRGDQDEAIPRWERASEIRVSRGQFGDPGSGEEATAVRLHRDIGDEDRGQGEFLVGPGGRAQDVRGRRDGTAVPEWEQPAGSGSAVLPPRSVCAGREGDRQLRESSGFVSTGHVGGRSRLRGIGIRRLGPGGENRYRAGELVGFDSDALEGR